jgi:transposase
LAARVTLREISNEDGNRLLRIVRRTSGSVVTWRRVQIVLLAAHGMTPARISEVVFTDPDTVREVVHNFNRDGFNALYPRYQGGRPPTFTLPKRQEIKRVALSDPQDLGQPFATWSLAKLAEYLVAEGVVTDISHEGLRQLLHQEASASSGEDLEALQCPRLRRQARPDRRALRASADRPGRRDLPG